MAVIPDINLVISGTSLMGVAGVIAKIIYDTKKLNGKGINETLKEISKNTAETNTSVKVIETEIIGIKEKCKNHDARIGQVETRTYELAGRARREG